MASPLPPWPIPRPKSCLQLPPRPPNRSSRFGDYVRSCHLTPAKTPSKGSQEAASAPSTDVEKLSSLLSKAQTPAQAIDIFDRELSKIESKGIPAFLCSIMLKVSPNTELYRQALRRDQQQRKSEELRAIDIAWLDKQWGGPDWLQQDIRLACSQPGVPFEPSAEFLTHMRKITSVAQANGIALNVLWADDGDLRYAATSHLAGTGQKAIVSGYGRPVSGVSREVSKMVADCIGLLPSAPFSGNHRQSSGVASHSESVCTNEIDEISLVPRAGETNKEVVKSVRNRSTISEIHERSLVNHTAQELTDSCREVANRKEHMYDAANSQYNRYKSVVAALTPEELEGQRAQAAKHLEEAEAEKAAADFALGGLKGREDQIQEIRQHSETYIQNEISGPTSQDGQLHPHAIGDKTFLDTFGKLRDSLLQTYPDNHDQSTSDQLRKRQTEAAKKLNDAQKRLNSLDHIEKAKFMQ
ncbi:uncharacterized protein FTOL_05781 [Fusarium torulosum]|uniref:Uncharacterized protein n=1 Tax=Fusarium torulosum TaxID=33205 RepID=A0AAE8SHE8_9HYPO|nr:uncharacterized protein FTOL_05781 [Fusarium torulosum]